MPITLQITLTDEQLGELATALAKAGSTFRREPYTLKEAAKALNMSANAIALRVRAGIILKLPDTGSRVLISAAEIQRFQDGKQSAYTKEIIASLRPGYKGKKVR